MEETVQSLAEVVARGGREESGSGLFSIEGFLKLQKLIFAGSPLSEVLTYIAQLVEAQTEGMSCTIWLPDEDGKELYCAAAPSLLGFSAQVGTMAAGPKGGSCGTAIFRREPVCVTRGSCGNGCGFGADSRRDFSESTFIPRRQNIAKSPLQSGERLRP